MAKKTTTDHAKTFMAEMNTLAEELYVVRQGLNTREERFKEETSTLYEKEAVLKADLLERLKAVGLTSVKVSSGDTWFISKRPVVDVKNELALQAWAIDQKLVKPDQDKIKARLKDMVAEKVDLPTFLGLSDRETISIRKAEVKKQ